MSILLQFVYRLAFGLAAAMALTSSRQVTSGYFRVHSYVLMGLHVLAAAVAFGSGDRYSPWFAVAGAVFSYLASVIWLYEKPQAGKVLLSLVSAASILAAWMAQSPAPESTLAADVLRELDPLGGGLVLGTTIAAMFLGHWYLNTPTMVLAPLKRLVTMMALALLFRAVLAAAGIGFELVEFGLDSRMSTAYLALRWIAGILGPLLLAYMSWETLKIPNTQSATGILYVAVILTFLGELAAILLSDPALNPQFFYPI